MAKVVILDTSILCVWLQLPHFGRCGPDNDPWDFERVDQKVQAEITADSSLVLPLATIIETGNHISQLTGDPFPYAVRLAQLLTASINNENPWAAFSEQGNLWGDDTLRRLAEEWPQLAAQRLSLGDATIKEVAAFYAAARMTVEILTGDAGLRSFQPAQPPGPIPRRRR